MESEIVIDGTEVYIYILLINEVAAAFYFFDFHLQARPTIVAKTCIYLKYC